MVFEIQMIDVPNACHACQELLEDHGAEHEPCRKLLRQRPNGKRGDGKPLRDPEEGTRPRSALPHAR